MTDTPTTDALIAELRALMAKADQEDDDVRYYGGPTGTYRPCRDALNVAMRNALPTLLDLAQPRAGASGEREACAAICEDLTFGTEIGEWLAMTKVEVSARACRECAKAIRARSEADEAPGVELNEDSISDEQIDAAIRHGFGDRFAPSAPGVEIPAGMVLMPRVASGEIVKAIWDTAWAGSLPRIENNTLRGSATDLWAGIIAAYTPIAQPLAPSREAVARAISIQAGFGAKATPQGWMYKAADAIRALTPDAAKSDAVKALNDRYQDALQAIKQWADAYPLDIFREPDLAKCAELLKAGGQTLDAVSASSMRHVISGVGNIARAALATPTAPSDQT